MGRCCCGPTSRQRGHFIGECCKWRGVARWDCAPRPSSRSLLLHRQASGRTPHGPSGRIGARPCVPSYPQSQFSRHSAAAQQGSPRTHSPRTRGAACARTARERIARVEELRSLYHLTDSSLLTGSSFQYIVPKGLGAVVGYPLGACWVHALLGSRTRPLASLSAPARTSNRIHAGPPLSHPPLPLAAACSAAHPSPWRVQAAEGIVGTGTIGTRADSWLLKDVVPACCFAT